MIISLSLENRTRRKMISHSFWKENDEFFPLQQCFLFKKNSKTGEKSFVIETHFLINCGESSANMVTKKVIARNTTCEDLLISD